MFCPSGSRIIAWRVPSHQRNLKRNPGVVTQELGNSVAMLKSILVSIHGVREKCVRKDHEVKNVSEVAFGLIPVENSYECR